MPIKSPCCPQQEDGSLDSGGGSDLGKNVSEFEVCIQQVIN